MDVTVFGLAMPTYVIEDIQMDVAHGDTVTIPFEKANRSKDLWRGISSKQLFQIRTTPNAHPQPTPSTAAEKELRERVAQLEAERDNLRAQLATANAALITQQAESQRALIAQQEQLTTIIAMISKASLPVAGVVPGYVPGHAPTQAPLGVSGDAPTFIPSTITPENADARIETKQAEAENPALAGASSKLRELRQKPKP